MSSVGVTAIGRYEPLRGGASATGRGDGALRKRDVLLQYIRWPCHPPCGYGMLACLHGLVHKCMGCASLQQRSYLPQRPAWGTELRRTGSPTARYGCVVSGAGVKGMCCCVYLLGKVSRTVRRLAAWHRTNCNLLLTLLGEHACACEQSAHVVVGARRT